MPPREDGLAQELAWLRDFTPATRSSAEAMPSLRGERLLVVCHLDLKMVPYFEAILAAGAEVRTLGIEFLSLNAFRRYIEDHGGLTIPEQFTGPQSLAPA